MSDPAGNPFEPPGPAADLPVDRDAGRAARVTEVTFRYSHDDLRRAMSGGSVPPALSIPLIVGLAAVGLGIAVWQTVRREGWSPEVIPSLAISTLPVVAIVVIVGVLLARRRGRGPSDAPFETTITLTPSDLIVREEGISELRRSWSSIADVTHDRHQIRIDFRVFDTSTNRFLPQPGQFVPIRAFASEEDAASFLAAARAYLEAAPPTISTS